LLAEKTRNLLEGEISTSTRSDRIAHNFNIVVPALDDYRYELFRVSHAATLYPVSVEAGPLEGDTNLFSPKSLASEEAFVNWLKAVFSSPQTKRVVSALLSQVEV
jgi:hypothetical protein